ncbi:MAG: permease prefix domain 1-containing protein [Nitrolancea sp.]
MPKPDQSDVRGFLAQVRQQLTALEYREQKEILEELSAHLQDAITGREQQGLDERTAVADALASMGDPESIGRRLREEHLNQRLSIRETALAIAPLLAIVWVFSHVWVLQTVRNAGSGNNSTDVVFGNLLPIMLVVVLGLWRSRQVWPATLLGGAGVYGLLAAHRLVGVTSHSATNILWFTLAGIAIVPLALVFTLRYGSLHASMAILSGVMSYGLLAWFVPDSPWVSSFVVAVPLIGIAAVCQVPRRWRAAAVWTALTADCLLIVLFPAVIFNHSSLASLPLYGPPSFGRSMQMVSIPVLVGSGLLLLGVQLVTRMQAQGRFERWTTLVS